MLGGEVRKSERAKRGPDRYVPTPNSRATARSRGSTLKPRTPSRLGARAKGYVSSEETQDEQSEEQSEAQSSTEGEDTGDEYEEETPNNSRKKRKAKDGGKNVRTGERKKRTPGPSAKRGTKQENASNQEGIEMETGLLREVVDGEVALETVAENWIERFMKNNREAVSEFLELVIRLAGIGGNINEEDLKTEQLMEQSIEKLVEEGLQKEEKINIIILEASKSNKNKLKQSLEFIEKIMTNGKEELIYGSRDEKIKNKIEVIQGKRKERGEEEFTEFFKVIGKYLQKLSNSEYRPFRQVGTVVLCSIMTELVRERKENRDELETISRQLESQAKNTGGNRRASKSGRQAQLEELQAEMQRREGIVYSIGDWVLTKILHLRYRDVYDGIRAETIKYLGEWIREDSISLLETKYLRYFGWLMHDDSDKVRHAAVEGVRKIISRGDVEVAQFSEFFERFGSRLVQLSVADGDSSVSASSLKLLKVVLENGMMITGTTEIREALEPVIKSGTTNEGDKASKKKGRKKKSSKFSQQLIEEDEEMDEEMDEEGGDGGDNGNDGEEMEEIVKNAETTNKEKVVRMQGIIQLYDDEGENVQHPSNEVMNYVAPLLYHGLVTIRTHAAELVEWWIRKEWIPFYRGPGGSNENDAWFLYKCLAKLLCQISSTRNTVKVETSIKEEVSEFKGIILNNDELSIEERKWKESITKMGDNKRQDAAAAALLPRFPEFGNISGVLEYLGKDHSVTEGQNFGQTAASNQELMILFEGLLVALQNMINSHKSKAKGKAKKTVVESERHINIARSMKSIEAQVSQHIEGLIGRYLDNEGLIEQILRILDIVEFDGQSLYDEGQQKTLNTIVEQIEMVFSRYNYSIEITRLAVSILSRLDKSKVLEMSGVSRPKDSEEEEEAQHEDAGGTLIRKHFEAIVETVSKSHATLHYNQLYGMLIQLRALLGAASVTVITESNMVQVLLDIINNSYFYYSDCDSVKITKLKLYCLDIAYKCLLWRCCNTVDPAKLQTLADDRDLVLQYCLKNMILLTNNAANSEQLHFLFSCLFTSTALFQLFTCSRFKSADNSVVYYKLDSDALNIWSSALSYLLNAWGSLIVPFASAAFPMSSTDVELLRLSTTNYQYLLALSSDFSSLLLSGVFPLKSLELLAGFSGTILSPDPLIKRDFSIDSPKQHHLDLTHPFTINKILSSRFDSIVESTLSSLYLTLKPDVSKLATLISLLFSSMHRNYERTLSFHFPSSSFNFYRKLLSILPLGIVRFLQLDNISSNCIAKLLTHYTPIVLNSYSLTSFDEDNDPNLSPLSLILTNFALFIQKYIKPTHASQLKKELEDKVSSHQPEIPAPIYSAYMRALDTQIEKLALIKS